MTKLFCPPTVWISLLRIAGVRHPRPVVVAQGVLRRVGDAGRGPQGARPAAARRRASGTSTVRRRCRRWPRSCARTSSWRGSGRPAGRRSTSRPASSTTTTDRWPPGTVGEIVHRSPQAMVGYWDDAEKTAEAFRGGWFHSGDLGVLDADGYLSIVDRKKDMIKTGGENVASREVEEVLFAAPGRRRGRRLRHPRPALDRGRHRRGRARARATTVAPTELIEHVRRHLAGYKTPKHVAHRRRPAQEPERQDPQAPAARGVRPGGRAMRLGNVAGRAALLLGDEVADVETRIERSVRARPEDRLRRLGGVPSSSPPR